MIAGLVAGSDGAMFDVSKCRDGSSLESKVDDEGATLGTSQSNDATLDDAIETVSEGELPTDHEDGELSEELSDIFSDEEPSVASGSTSPWPDLVTGKSNGGSPAQLNPKTLEVAMGQQGVPSPGPSLVASRQSPTYEAEGEEEEEDLLYLRLMALRSIVPELAEMSKSSDENSPVGSPERGDGDSLVDEMEELLNEVDRAADESEDLPHILSTGICVDIATVIEKIKSAKNPVADVIIPDPDIGPSGSPICADEPDDDDDVVIVEEIVRPKAGQIKVSDFARIVEDDDVQVIEPRRDASSNCEPVDMDLSCENEAEIQFFKDQADPEKQKDSLFPPSVWQMGALLSQPPPPPPPPLSLGDAQDPSAREVLRFSSDEERYDAFLRAVFEATPLPETSTETRKRRKSEESQQQSVDEDDLSPPKKPRSDGDLENDEDVDSMRANILISMIERRKKKQIVTLSSSPKAKPSKTPTTSSPATLSSPATVSSPATSSSATSSSATTKTNPELQRLREDVECQKRHFPNLFKKVIIPTAASDDEEANEPNVSPANLGTDFSSNLENFLKDLRRKTSQPKKKLTPPPKPARKNPPGKQVPVATKAKITPTISPGVKSSTKFVRKLVYTQVKAPAGGPTLKPTPAKPSLSTKVKQDLMTSSVSFLPPEKQAEYKKLKAMIAKKERDRQLKLREQMLAKLKKSADAAAVDDDDEDAELLRSKLLASLQVKRKKVAEVPAKDKPAKKSKENSAPPSVVQSAEGGNSKPAVVRNRITGPGSSIPILMHRKIVSSTSPAQVLPALMQPSPDLASTPVAPSIESPPTSTPSDVASCPADDGATLELKKKEEELSSLQREMKQEIFKLSAQMSQLKEEAKTLEAARSFAEDLKRQLAEAEAIIVRSNNRVEQLKSTVRSSIVVIAAQRSAMVNSENECRKKGGDLVGPTYKPPQTAGSQNIKKKLALIKANAETLLSSGRQSPATDEAQQESPEAIVESVQPVEDKVTNETAKVMADGIDPSDVVSETQVPSVAVPNTDLLSSSLAHLRPGQVVHFDPHTQLCRFELLGKCNDDSCPYQHYQPKQKQQ